MPANLGAADGQEPSSQILIFPAQPHSGLGHPAQKPVLPPSGTEPGPENNNDGGFCYPDAILQSTVAMLALGARMAVQTE